MAFLIRIALVALALYVLWRACARLLRSLGMMSGQQTGPGHPGALPIDELVQDPVCGLYVPRHEAIELQGHGAPRYFCSDKCRDQYMRQEG